MLEDVHEIASAYHWSEREILALPVGRRDRYLALLAAHHDEELVRQLEDRSR